MEQHGSYLDLHHLCPQIAQKASSVFLWAVLVIDMMHRAWDSGRRVTEVERLIHTTPNQVKELFEQLAASFNDDERIEACRLFQWILFGNTVGIETLQYLILFCTKQYQSFRSSS
jgi:hypothetical protein